MHFPGTYLSRVLATSETLEVGMGEKRWGDEPYFGLGTDWDPDWLLTERQLELRDLLIELCEKEMRANAKVSDDSLSIRAATSSCSVNTASSA